MNTLNASAVLLVVFGLAFQNPTELARSTALARAEAQWQARGPRSYKYGIGLTCFCSPKGMNFHVVAGQSELPRGTEVASQRLHDQYGTVERLFAMIRRAITDGAYRLEVKYDSELGYPIWIDLDRKREVIDDEIFLRVTGFRKVGEPTWVGLPNKRLQPAASAVSSR
jgi:hypothetical protein